MPSGQTTRKVVRQPLPPHREPDAERQAQAEPGRQRPHSLEAHARHRLAEATEAHLQPGPRRGAQPLEEQPFLAVQKSPDEVWQDYRKLLAKN